MSINSSVPGASQAPSGAAPAPSATEDDRLMAGLAYIIALIVPLIILLSEASKSREFQRFHARQALGLDAAALVYWVLLTLFGCVLSVIPVLQALTCLLPIFYLLPVVPFLYYGYQAYQGKTFEIPVVTQFMRAQKWL